MRAFSETESERVERQAMRLAETIDRRGFAKFPKRAWPGWSHEQLVEHRRELSEAVALLRETRGVEVVEDAATTVVRWRP